MDEIDAKTLAKVWFEQGMNAGSAAAARAIAENLFDEDFIDHDGINGATDTREEFLRNVIDPIFAGFSDVHVAIEHLVGEGDIVACRYSFEGLHTGPFNGIPATGRMIRHTENEMFRISAGRIRESWGEGDWVGTLRQFGLIPQPMPAEV
jgi:predicted ester cyclase